ITVGLTGWRDVAVSLVAFCAVMGHLYPVFLKFKGGGKGVATVAGCFLAISPAACAGTALIFVLLVWRYRMVSVGSLASAAALPAMVWLSERAIVFTALAVVVAIFIYIRHAENIERLRLGTEPRLGEKKDGH
ncbi:MAG: glycerol-3-phosphate acyltransferase, partial [Deltaproteobacteria bacterium]|nr:glycerol-3-phosphate acyltransferase [Deltaproteobacteria bacterium]